MSMAEVAPGPADTRLRPARTSGAASRRGSQVAGWWGLWLVLGVGTALRAADLLSYPRALMLWGDSYLYLNDAARLHPSGQHPLGYPLFLAALRPFGSLVVVPVVQHLLGLGLGVGSYLLLRRLGVRRSLAAVGAAPVLLDPYQIQLEQFVLAETWTSVLLLAVVALMLVPGRPSLAVCAAAGALLAVATLSRTVAGIVLVPLLVAAVTSRWGWRRSAVLAGATVLPLLVYAVWFHSYYGQYGLDNLGNRALYGRTATIADCARLRLPAVERRLCDPAPRTARQTPNFYAWEASPLNTVRFPRGVRPLAVAGSFSKHVIEQQPLSYARLVAEDLVHYVGVDRVSGRDDWPVAAWQQQPTIYPRRWHVLIGPASFSGQKFLSARALPAQQQAHGPISWLRAYQRHIYVPGWSVALAGLLGLLSAARFRPARSTPPPVRLGTFTAVTAASTLLLVAVPALFVPFDFRYLLPAQLLAGPALVGAFELWRSERERPRTGPPLRRRPVSS